MASNLAIIAKNLTKRFGEFVAVDGVDFEVRRGEIFGFLGPNGSGKTTTIRMMLGLMSPSAGDVAVLGIRVSENPEKIRPRVGYMSQRFSLYNDLTVIENLRFYGRAYGLDDKELHRRIPDAMRMAGLEAVEQVRTRDLSGGWRQRLALSATILHRPELLFSYRFAIEIEQAEYAVQIRSSVKAANTLKRSCSGLPVMISVPQRSQACASSHFSPS